MKRPHPAEQAGSAKRGGKTAGAQRPSEADEPDGPERQSAGGQPDSGAQRHRTGESAGGKRFLREGKWRRGRRRQEKWENAGRGINDMGCGRRSAGSREEV